ncbi:MAG: zinc metalloprotease [Acidiferrobacterales bacterium]|nr:zinc metalloprotease [Acidiferrobacterales bacterium]
MENQLRHVFISFGLAFFACNCSVQAQDEGDFRRLDNGNVEIQGRLFSNMQSYLSSDFFREIGGRCAADRMSSERYQMPSDMLARSPADCDYFITKILAEYEPTVLMSIPVWFHVITTSTGEGNITDAEIDAQMEVLNEDFRALSGTLGAAGNGIDTKLEFTLAGITRTVNNAWYTDSDTDEDAYKAALGKDQSKYLNVYTNDARGALGYATFPFFSAGTIIDGVVMNHISVGGRNNSKTSGYNYGRTLVHEVGHYLGLLHTFQTFSSEPLCANTFATGDLIVDTNAELSPFYGEFTGSVPNCNATSFSCSNADSVANYMNYNYDLCMNEFTSQQVNRIICSALNYRPDLLSVVDKSGNIVPILQLLLDG